MNEPSSPVFCPSSSPSTRLCKTDASQDGAGGKELRDRVIPGRYFPGCGKSKMLAIRVSERCPTGPTRRQADRSNRTQPAVCRGLRACLRKPSSTGGIWLDNQLPSLHIAGAHAGYRFQFEKAVMTEVTKISPTLIVLSGLPGSGRTVLAESLTRA